MLRSIISGTVSGLLVVATTTGLSLIAWPELQAILARGFLRMPDAPLWVSVLILLSVPAVFWGTQLALFMRRPDPPADPLSEQKDYSGWQDAVIILTGMAASALAVLIPMFVMGLPG
jgi:hypothetical protein